MSMVAIKVEDVSKQYRLGSVGTGSLKDDIKRWRYQMMGKEDPFLQVGDVNERTTKKTSEYVWALQNLNFDVEQGDIVGIIGRNGAGKSTLLKLLSRTTAPTIGTIKMKGRVASLLEVGTGFHGELSGRENIYLNGAILGMRKNEINRKLAEIVDFAGIEKYIDTPVKRYSSGMYVRLAFAVAAHLESEILILDEVLAVGDAEFQTKALGKVNEVSKGQGRTVLFVSHNMASMSSLCSSGILMENGGIVFKGSIESCIKTYQSKSKKVAEVEIGQRVDRMGNGLLRFTHLNFLNKDLDTQQQFLSGDEVNIRIFYKTLDNRVLKNVLVGIGIVNNSEIQLTIASNEISGELFKQLPPEGFINCKIPRLPLITGLYRLNLFCSVNGEISDWVLNTCNFNVETGDFYKTGKNTDNFQSLFIMDYTFYHAAI